MFHDGDLQSGISRAIQEQKLVACFVSQDGNEQCTTWENTYLPSVRDALAPKAVFLKIDLQSQEANFLKAFCPVSEAPTLVLINNGQVLELLRGEISQVEFQERLGKATGTEISQNQQASRSQEHAGAEVDDASAEQPSPHRATTQRSPEQDTQDARNQSIDPVTQSKPDEQDHKAAEKAERAARAVARRKEIEKAQSVAPDKGKQRATDETAEKRKARQDWVAQQKQRKDEARQERQRILEQIENDKQERKVRAQEQQQQQQQKAADEVSGPLEPLRVLTNPASRKTTGSAAAAGGGGDSKCSLQIRLFDGSSIRGRFDPASATLASDVRGWIQATASDAAASEAPYTFRQILAPQPSRAIEVSEEHQTLADLELAPSATLVLAPVTGATDAYASAGPAGYAGATVSAAYGLVGGVARVVSSALSYVPGLAAAPSPAEESRATAAGAGRGAAESALSQAAESGSAKRNVKTFSDQRADAVKRGERKAEFYNGNSSAFEGRKDEDDET